ncbi:MAG: antibiotic biosynthesis monooxygenase [Syntrophales bacterium]|nr:antibiotic biosynthesis monooxygenase [Syntrophales bacterium]
MIHVIATIELAEQTRPSYLDALRKIIPMVRAEEGCLEYGPAADVHTGIQVQDPINENAVTLIERWTDVDALKVHLTAPHMQTYRKAVKDFVKRVSIRILEPL